MIPRTLAFAIIPFSVALAIERPPHVAAQSLETSSVWSGVYTAEQATRGRNEYQTYCATCHGETLLGSPSAPPLARAEFIREWSGLSVNDLLKFIGMEMPFDNPGSLASNTYRDITAFVLQANQFPPGTRELPESETALKRLVISESR